MRPDRHPSESYEDILDRDTRSAPTFLRQGPTPDLGNEPIPASSYFDAEHFKLEVEHVWLKVWQWACREEEIPNPGDVFVYENVGKSVIVARQKDGSIKAFYNSCLHRGRKLVDANGSKVDFRCKYHGMIWTCAGKFKYNPISWDFPQLEGKDFSLPELKVECWGGFVFVNFDLDAQPLAELIRPLAEHFESYDYANRYKAVHLSKVVDCNWKVLAEAFMESHHTVATHPQLSPFLADVNSQYDLLSDDVSRQFTATAVVSPVLSDRNLSDLDILKAMEVAGSADPDETPPNKGRTNNARDTVAAPITLQDGQTARTFAAESLRTALQAEDGWDYSSVSDAEMLDALLYNLFPHQSFWGGFAPNLVYRWRPNGLDPESSIMDVVILKRVPKDGQRPKPVPDQRLGPDEPWSSSPALAGALGPVFEQDMGNLSHVQEGLHTSGTGKVQLALYSEARIRHLHQKIGRMIAEGQARSS